MVTLSRIRWYLAMARLYYARGRALPWRELSSRVLPLLLACAVLYVVPVFMRAPAPEPGQPHGAYIQLIIMVVMLVIALLVSYAMRPKPKDPKVQDANIPVVEDGKSLIDVWGTVWIDDSIVLGFKKMGTEKIKAKTGK